MGCRIMKKTTVFILLLMMIGMLWGTWSVACSYAFSCGYLRGSHDERSRWTILSMGDEPYPKTTMTGVRLMWVHSDRTPYRAPRSVPVNVRTLSVVNNITEMIPK